LQQNERKQEEAASDSWDAVSDEDHRDEDDSAEVCPVPCASEMSAVTHAASGISETHDELMVRKYL